MEATLKDLASGWLHGRFSLRWVIDHHPEHEQVRHRQLDHYTLWWCRTGTWRINTPNQTIHLAEGQAVLLPPVDGLVESVGIRQRMARCFVMGFAHDYPRFCAPPGSTDDAQPLVAAGLDPLRRIALPGVWTPDDPHWPWLVDTLLEHPEEVVRNQVMRCRLRGIGEALVWSAITALVHAGAAMDNPAPMWLAAVRQMLNRSMKRCPPIAQLAQVAGVSATHLCRVFRTVHGTTPSAWNRRARMEQAGRLLLSLPEVELREIASRFGFKSLPAFSRAFRAHHGLAPRHFLTRARAEARVTS